MTLCCSETDDIFQVYMNKFSQSVVTDAVNHFITHCEKALYWCFPYIVEEVSNIKDELAETGQQ